MSSRTLIDPFDGIPVLQDLFAGPPFGTGIFTAALILAVMVIPFIAATMRDVFERCRRCSRNPPTASAAPRGR